MSVASQATDREVLPRNVVPRHYDLTIEPDWQGHTFKGEVVIDLDIIENTTFIILNTIDLELSGIWILKSEPENMEQPHLRFDEGEQTTTIELSATLLAGSTARLKIAYIGLFNEGKFGFCRYFYRMPDGRTPNIAGTNMLPLDCRRVFPCWDEPGMKAHFTITLVADLDHICLSNMDIAEELEITSIITGTKRRFVKFNKSPLMPTYLVAFVIGELKCIQSTDSFRVPIRVFATPNYNIEHGRLGLDITGQTLAYYEKVFNIDYPLPKMDSVIIPNFSSDGAKNWGLIIQDGSRLFDKDEHGKVLYDTIIWSIQYELAHQWFGNLVTIDWWESLWLVEAFAYWMVSFSFSKVYPDRKTLQAHISECLQETLDEDSWPGSNLIEVKLQTTDQVLQVFNPTAHIKGAAILRMISSFLGEEIFLNGVRQFLKQHAYGTTKTDDFWDALTIASGMPLAQYMENWIYKSGFPVLRVTESSNDNTIHITQSRFLRTSNEGPEIDDISYPVTLGLQTRNLSNNNMLYERSCTIKLDSLDFFVLNANHTGIYRTLYYPTRLEKLGEAAQAGLLTAQNRAIIVADAAALSAAGYQLTSALLSLLQHLKRENEFEVWKEIADSVLAIQEAWMFESKSVKKALDLLLMQLLGPKLEEIGWKINRDEDPVQQHLKGILFTYAGFAGNEHVILDAKDMFRRYRDGDTNAIHPNIRYAVFTIALLDGGNEEFKFVVGKYQNATNSRLERDALAALWRACDTGLVKGTLRACIWHTIDTAGCDKALSGLSAHRLGIEERFKWLRENWEGLKTKYQWAPDKLADMVSICLYGLCTSQHIAEVESFFRGEDTRAYIDALMKSLNAIRERLAWVERDREDVSQWLRENGYLWG